MDEFQKFVQYFLDNYFPYLKSFGFKDLREEENYFICPWYFLNNGMVELSIQYQGKAELLHLHINKYNFRLLEPANTKLIDIENRFNTCYKIAYNSSKQSKKKIKKVEKAIQQLEEIEIEWLIEMSAVLFRHSNAFNGNLELLEKNFEQKYQNDKAIKTQEKIRKGLFSLELYEFSGDGEDPFYDEENPFNCVLEFPSLDEVKSFLKDNKKVKIYRILDCYLNEIKICDD